MNLYQNFNTIKFSVEMLYSLIIVVMFFYIFFKTKELYSISKHKGIKYFRYAFLFFGIGYISRILYYLIKLFIITSSFHVPGRILSTISLLFIGYFGTIAIGYLIYSNIWKKLNYKIFLASSNIFAIIVLLLSTFYFSLYFIIIIQFLLMTLILFIDKNKPIKILYSLISLFWIINMIVFYSRNIFPFEIKIGLQILSLFVLSFFIYRVSKWIK